MATAQREHEIITAFLARSSAAGWNMLPMKATEEMSLAGIKIAPPGMVTSGEEDAFQICWGEMARAAPVFTIRYPSRVAPNNLGGFIDGNGTKVAAGDRVGYRFYGLIGVLEEALQDGDATVIWDNGDRATVKWCNLAKLPEEMYLLKRNGLWYRPNACGYTSIISLAGRYTKDEAEAHCRASGTTLHSVSSFVDEIKIRQEELRQESAEIKARLESLQPAQ